MEQGKYNGHQTILYDHKYDLALPYELLRCLIVDSEQPLKRFVGFQVDIYDPNGVSVFDVNQPKCVLVGCQIIGDTIRPWFGRSKLYSNGFLSSYSDITPTNKRMFKLMGLTKTEVRSLLGQAVLVDSEEGE